MLSVLASFSSISAPLDDDLEPGIILTPSPIEFFADGLPGAFAPAMASSDPYWTESDNMIIHHGPSLSPSDSVSTPPTLPLSSSNSTPSPSSGTGSTTEAYPPSPSVPKLKTEANPPSTSSGPGPRSTTEVTPASSISIGKTIPSSISPSSGPISRTEAIPPSSLSIGTPPLPPPPSTSKATPPSSTSTEQTTRSPSTGQIPTTDQSTPPSSYKVPSPSPSSAEVPPLSIPAKATPPSSNISIWEAPPPSAAAEVPLLSTPSKTTPSSTEASPPSSDAGSSQVLEKPSSPPPSQVHFVAPAPASAQEATLPSSGIQQPKSATAPAPIPQTKQSPFKQSPPQSPPPQRPSVNRSPPLKPTPDSPYTVSPQIQPPSVNRSPPQEPTLPPPPPSYEKRSPLKPHVRPPLKPSPDSSYTASPPPKRNTSPNLNPKYAAPPTLNPGPYSTAPSPHHTEPKVYPSPLSSQAIISPKIRISPSSSPSSLPSTIPAVIASCSFLIFLAVVIWIICFVHKKKKLKKKTSMSPGNYQSDPSKADHMKAEFQTWKSFNNKSLRQGSKTNELEYKWNQGSGTHDAPCSSYSFQYKELRIASSGFSMSNLLGEGGFGCVYKGILSNGTPVAIKQLKLGGGQGEKEFQAEVETISRVHHRHLVSLVGYCISEEQRLLVYEYVPNGNLDQHLHRKKECNGQVMDWPTRMKIAKGAARGLAYLHEDCHPRVIHRDIKSSNILLDNNFEALVSDFGLAKISPDAITHVTTRVIGTFGYLAPEYASTGKLTEKSDVFSFGVVLLELITGRKPVDVSQPLGEESLVEWARPLFSQVSREEDLHLMADPLLNGNFEPNEMLRMVQVAAACIRHSATIRPRMGQVARALEDDASNLDINQGLKPGLSMLQHNSSDNSDNNSTLLSLKNMMLFVNSGAFSDHLQAGQRNGLCPSHGIGYGSEGMGYTSEYGLNPSSSSSEEHPIGSLYGHGVANEPSRLNITIHGR